MKKLSRNKEKALKASLARFATDFSVFLSSHDYGEFVFSAILKDGCLVHSYSISEKTTHKPISEEDGLDWESIKKEL